LTAVPFLTVNIVFTRSIAEDGISSSAMV